MANFVAFLEFRTHRRVPPQWDDGAMAALYAEFAEEDHLLAEVGMSDYAGGLAKEDAAA